MIETFNDFISFAVLIFLFFAAAKLLLASFRNSDDNVKKHNSILSDYIDNEDE